MSDLLLDVWIVNLEWQFLQEMYDDILKIMQWVTVSHLVHLQPQFLQRLATRTDRRQSSDS